MGHPVGSQLMESHGAWETVGGGILRMRASHESVINNYEPYILPLIYGFARSASNFLGDSAS